MDIEEKKLEMILVEQREEYQRYLGVLQEDFQPQVKLVAESVVGIQQQLMSIREMVAKNTEDLEMMRMDLHVIRADLKEKIGRDEFVILESRVAKLEKSLQS